MEGEEEDTNISISDCSDSIHEEICLHFEYHFSTLNNLQRTHKSPSISCVDTTHTDTDALSSLNIGWDDFNKKFLSEKKYLKKSVKQSISR